jgi:hypothetical protein
VAVQTLAPSSAAFSGSAARAVASPSPLALPLSAVAGRSGADVRVALDLLLQEQVFLSALAMDAASSARLDELGGAMATLDQNSMALAEVLGAVKGQESAQALLAAWRGLIADLIDYAQGQHATAMADLERRQATIASQLSMGEFSEAAASDLLGKRIQAQLSLADAIVSHDAAPATQRLRSAAAASDELGRPLAAAIAARAPLQAPRPTEGLDIDVRVALTRALQAQTYLSGAAAGAAADGRTSDLQALVGAANDNATDLGRQLGSVYGSALGDGLAERWRAETAALVSAASGGDRRQAVADLDRLRGELDDLLSGANTLLPPGLMKQQLRASDQPLLIATDTFASRDFGTAYVRLREAARLSQKPADTLALSIVDRYPGRYFVPVTPTPRR